MSSMNGPIERSVGRAPGTSRGPGRLNTKKRCDSVLKHMFFMGCEKTQLDQLCFGTGRVGTQLDPCLHNQVANYRFRSES